MENTDKQYNNISIFKARPGGHPRAPHFDVLIEMADGTKYRGGLWQSKSLSGINYLRGALEVDTGQYAKREPSESTQSKDDLIDF